MQRQEFGFGCSDVVAVVAAVVVEVVAAIVAIEAVAEVEVVVVAAGVAADGIDATVAGHGMPAASEWGQEIQSEQPKRPNSEPKTQYNPKQKNTEVIHSSHP